MNETPNIYFNNVIRARIIFSGNRKFAIDRIFSIYNYRFLLKNTKIFTLDVTKIYYIFMFILGIIHTKNRKKKLFFMFRSLFHNS